MDFDSILLDLSCLTAAPVADTQADDPDNGSSSIQQTQNSSQIDPQVSTSSSQGNGHSHQSEKPDTVLLNVLEQNVTTYISGYMLNKLTVPMNCPACHNSYRSVSIPENNRFTYLKFKEHIPGILQYPSNALCLFLDKLEIDFKVSFPIIMAREGILKRLEHCVTQILADSETKCQNCLNLLKKVGRKYMGLRLHHVLDMFNKAAPQERGKAKKNRKMQKLMHV